MVASVVEASPQGLIPVAGAMINFNYRRPGETFSTGGSVFADSNGRYELPHVLFGTYLQLRADKGARSQPCASYATVVGNMTLTVELVSKGSPPSQAASPIVSGMVYENTPQGRRPIEGYAIGYQSNCRGLVQVYGWTDTGGRYSFCNLPRGDGCVIVFVPTPDWDTVDRVVPINVQGDHVVDIEIIR